MFKYLLIVMLSGNEGEKLTLEKFETLGQCVMVKEKVEEMGGFFTTTKASCVKLDNEDDLK
jgi:transposase-like protein